MSEHFCPEDGRPCNDCPPNACEKQSDVFAVSAEEGESLAKFGVGAGFISQLAILVGPEIAKAVLALVAKKLKFGGPLDKIGLGGMEVFIASMLRSYKDKIGDKAEAWVESGIDKLADYLEGKKAEPKPEPKTVDDEPVFG